MTFDARAYQEFLASKSPADAPSGLAVVPPLSPALKPFQAAIVGWALRRGRAAIFAGTGLGKTLMQLIWAHEVINATGRPVLILCPLAVAEQTVMEADKFGVPFVKYAADQSEVAHRITVTNYERFEKFNPDHFVGIVLDESGIIKSHDGKTRKLLTESCQSVPWRLCCTATPSPNDYTELGQHSEFLGVMDSKEMLAMFFVHDGSIRAGDATQGNDGWRMKRHAAADFWRWLASWSVMVRHPRDLGFDEPGYDLPPLNLHQVTVAAEYKPTAGELFPMQASTLAQRIGVRRDTIDARIKTAVDIIRETEKSCKTNENTNVGIGISTNTNMLSLHQSETRRMQPDGNVMLQMHPTGRALSQKPEVAAATCAATANSNTVLACLLPTTNASGSIRGVDVQSAELPNQIPLGSRSPSIIVTKQGLSEDCYAHPAMQDLDTSRTIATYLPEQSNISQMHGERWIVWCKLNKEQEILSNILKKECFSVYGSLAQEEKIARIQGWLRGERPILVTKPSICGWGLNMQVASKMIFVGASDSFEETYQSVRRSWRFGQLRAVDAYFIASELEGNVVANLKRKETAFELMLDAMSDHMRDLQKENVLGGRNATFIQSSNKLMEVPAWIR